MPIFDIVYIKGNPNSGTFLQHEQINNSILKLIQKYSFKIINSEYKNLSSKKIPQARIYIGFSRGSRYLNKLSTNSLKISIGGISGSKIHLFRNINDNILSGDISYPSMAAHFIISCEDIVKIKKLINDLLH